jgi:hypothetical protein
MDVKLKISAQLHGINLYNFGEGKDWNGYFTKNQCYIDGLESLKDKYGYVIGVDAMDVLFMDSLDNTIKEYNENYLGKLVFNGEDFDGTNAAYDNAYSNRIAREDYLNHRTKLNYTSTNKYKYLNSGCFIGPIDKVIWAMKEAYKYKDRWGGNVDNGPMEEVYLSTNDIVVDEECRIFQTLSDNEAGGVNFDLVYKEGKPFNKRYGTSPTILHGPGKCPMVQPWRILTNNYY